MSNTKKCDSPGTLHTRTRQLLNTRPEGLLELSEKLGVPFYWLKKFAGGDINKPSVDRIQYLFEKLSGKSLSL